MTAKRVWRCGECYAMHRFESEARECCQPDDQQQDDPAKLRAELELAGQGRLVE